MSTILQKVVTEASGIVVGKKRQIQLCVSCLLARGHLLIEDIPGIGKTTLAHTLARILGLEYQRIQFTSDILPADVLGVSIFNRDGNKFEFHPGPIFTQVLLADEINRATPKAQSALLEAMEERQVTFEGETRRLPEPFFVVATQNPAHIVGTFPLPESQLDRFLMRIDLGYPDPESERGLLIGEDRRDMLERLEPIVNPEELMRMQKEMREVHISEALLDYLQALLAFSRDSARFRVGLSPRAGLGLQGAAKAWAYLDGRDHVIPEDVQAIAGAVVNHRLLPTLDESETTTTEELVQNLLESVPVP